MGVEIKPQVKAPKTPQGRRWEPTVYILHDVLHNYSSSLKGQSQEIFRMLFDIIGKVPASAKGNFGVKKVEAPQDKNRKPPRRDLHTGELFTLRQLRKSLQDTINIQFAPFPDCLQFRCVLISLGKTFPLEELSGEI
jgi:hypothetical protein